MYRSLTAGPDALWICTLDRPSAGGAKGERGKRGDRGSVLEMDDAQRVVARLVGDRIAMGVLRSALAAGTPGLSFRTMSDRDVVKAVEREVRRSRFSLGRRGGGDTSGTLSGVGGSSGGGSGSGGSSSGSSSRAEEPPTSPDPAQASNASIPQPQSARPSSAVQPTPDPAAPVTAAPVADEPPLSFYELVLLDELEVGIPGVPIDLTTPAGRETLTTDGSGRVRVNDAPPGSATARVITGPELTRVLEENIAIAKRTTPLPVADDLLVLTPSRLDQTILFPDAIPQRVMLVTRTDLVWGSVVGHWGTLTLLSQETDPVRLLADIGSSILQLSSTGASPSALIGTPVTGLDTAGGGGSSALGFADGLITRPSPPARLSIDIDALHEALFADDFDAASALIDLAQQGPPEPPLPEFPVLGDETAEFAAQLALLAFSGETDVPTIPDKQV